MQSALRSATRRAVAISSRRGVATAATTTTTTTTKAATASEDWLAEHEKAWVKAMVQREVRAQMAAEEERRIARDRLRAAAAEERPTCRCRGEVDDARMIRLCFDFALAAMQGCVLGAGVGIMIYGR